jgi:hypothetical protein
MALLSYRRFVQSGVLADSRLQPQLRDGVWKYSRISSRTLQNNLCDVPFLGAEVSWSTLYFHTILDLVPWLKLLKSGRGW